MRGDNLHGEDTGMLEKLFVATSLTFALQLIFQLGTFSDRRTTAELNIPATTTASVTQLFH